MLAPALALLLAAAPAAAPPSDNASCLNLDAGAVWKPVDARTLRVEEGPRRFRVRTAACPALTRPDPRVQMVLPQGGLICRPADAHLYVAARTGPGPQRCAILAITREADARP